MRGAPFTRALDHALPLLRTRVLPALAQLLALLLRQALELAEILTCCLLARGGQGAKIFPASPQQLSLLRGQLLKLIEALPGRRALLLRHAQPTLAAAGERLLALCRQLLPLPRKPRQQTLLILRQ